MSGSGFYCVNINAQLESGDHEVHNETNNCQFLPETSNRYPLGYHLNCQSAVAAAKRIYTQTNGCYYCANDCHTG